MHCFLGAEGDHFQQMPFISPVFLSNCEVPEERAPLVFDKIQARYVKSLHMISFP